MQTIRTDKCLYTDCQNKTDFGYCKTTACINPKYSQKQFIIKPEIKTNGDKIRSMTNEELVKLFTCIDMFCCPVKGEDCSKNPSCEECFVRWLNKETNND